MTKQPNESWLAKWFYDGLNSMENDSWLSRRNSAVHKVAKLFDGDYSFFQTSSPSGQMENILAQIPVQTNTVVISGMVYSEEEYSFFGLSWRLKKEKESTFLVLNFDAGKSHYLVDVSLKNPEAWNKQAEIIKILKDCGFDIVC